MLGVTTVSNRRSWCHLCRSNDSLLNERTAVTSGPVCCQRQPSNKPNTVTLIARLRVGKRMKIDRNVMNCLGILNAILTDIGLQFRGNIMPELPTAPVERLFRIQSHPINNLRRRKQMVWGDIAGCDEKPQLPVLCDLI